MTAIKEASSRSAEPPARAVDQAALVTSLCRPAVLGPDVERVRVVETHISYVLLTGTYAYKIKKAVDLQFLNFTTLDARRYYCHEELRLNRRLAPSVYIGVVPITCDQSGWRLGGWGEPAEYGLVMRRLPERRMLPFLLETNQTTTEMMRELAVVLARFHGEATRVDASEARQYFQKVAQDRKSVV